MSIRRLAASSLAIVCALSAVAIAAEQFSDPAGRFTMNGPDGIPATAMPFPGTVVSYQFVRPDQNVAQCLVMHSPYPGGVTLDMASIRASYDDGFSKEGACLEAAGVPNATVIAHEKVDVSGGPALVCEYSYVTSETGITAYLHELRVYVPVADGIVGAACQGIALDQATATAILTEQRENFLTTLQSIAVKR